MSTDSLDPTLVPRRAPDSTIDSAVTLEPPTLARPAAAVDPESAPALARTEIDSGRREPGTGTLTSARASAPLTPSSHPEVDVAPAPLDDHGFLARYEARGLLGEGGMGEVRLCRDKRIGRDVAVKVIRPGHGSRSDVRARFEREARVQGQLEHPSIVPVYDLGLGPDGAAFFTMKRVRGVTPEDVLDGRRRGDAATIAAYSRRRILTAFAGVCLAVAFAHDRGVIHRDLKPGNVMLGSYGELYVLDWGLAKIGSAPELAAEGPIEAPLSEGAHTVDGALMGTPGYMAPEQVRGETGAIDARADVYALGAILFELLAVEPLHARTTLEAILASTLKGADARPSARAPELGIPPELDALCARAVALDPGERFPTARELSQAVERFLDGDRDLEQRRAMAEKHAEAANEAIAIAEAVGPGADEARQRALSELGAALALEPTHAGALGAMARLLLEAPKKMTPAARAEFDASQAAADAAGRRGTLNAYLAIAAAVPLLLFLGIRDYRIFTVDAVISAVVLVAAFFVTRGPGSGLMRLLLFATAMIGLAVSSFFLGPLILLPGLVAGQTSAFMILGQREHRSAAITLGVLAIVVPFGLQMAGVMPRSYDFSHGGMTVLPMLTELPEGPTLAFLLLANVILVISPAVLLSRVRGALAASEERVFLHAYNLRHLVPQAARAAAAVPAPPPEPVCIPGLPLRRA